MRILSLTDICFLCVFIVIFSKLCLIMLPNNASDAVSEVFSQPVYLESDRITIYYEF